MSTIQFSKIVATGNDFVVIDNRAPVLPNRARAAKFLCDRRWGIGADGLLLIEKSKRADFKMRIFNPDGSETQMCGNGSRCIALYAKANAITPSHMTIETKAGMLKASVGKKFVRINMTDPKDIKPGIDIDIEGKAYQLNFVNTGVPHAVYFTDDIAKINVERLGRAIRRHRAFSPHGANVDFVQPKTRNTLLMRTYERGVEAETFACGTGAVASAVISGIIKGFKPPVKVDTKGGVLTIYFKREKNKFTNVFLEGEVKEVFKGEVKNV